MGKTLDEMIATLPARRRRKVGVRTAELIAEEMTLRELRRAMGKTQAQVARLTGKPQATISRMEAQSDMLLSNLDQVVRALGGRVRVLAELPGRAPVMLNGLGDLIAADPMKRTPVARATRPGTVKAGKASARRAAAPTG